MISVLEIFVGFRLDKIPKECGFNFYTVNTKMYIVYVELYLLPYSYPTWECSPVVYCVEAYV